MVGHYFLLANKLLLTERVQLRGPGQGDGYRVGGMREEASLRSRHDPPPLLKPLRQTCLQTKGRDSSPGQSPDQGSVFSCPS